MKTLLLPLAFALAALPAAAQLDLPDKAPKAKPGPGVELPAKPRGDVRPRPAGDEALGGLDVPASKGAPDTATGTEAAPPAGSLLESGPTGAIFDYLRELKKPTGRIIEDAAFSLSNMGADGLTAARLGLREKQHGVVLASAQCLLLSKDPEDRKLVRPVLETKLPSRTLGPLLELEVASHTVEDGNKLLLELLDHKRSTLRKVAGKQYRLRADEVALGTLLKLAKSNRSDTRLLSVELLSHRQGDDVDGALLGLMADSIANVATAAGESIALRITGPDYAHLPVLLTQARLQGYEDNAGAQALLAVLKAESRLGVALLPESEDTSLVVHMRSGSPFVSTTAAAALAGIGFRSAEQREYMNLEVPHTLVASLSGGVYFPEYASIRPLAFRRLSQITGQYFGTDNTAWQQWWLSHARDFKALRAVMGVELAQHEALEVRWYSPRAGESFRLLGSLATKDSSPYAGSTLRLVPSKSADLMKTLIDANVFGAERMPGLVGTSNGIEDEFEVRVGDQSKLFRFGTGANVTWFEPVMDSLEDFREQSVWQLFPGVQHGLTEEGRKAFFQSEASFWSSERTELERDRRLVSLILDHATLLPIEQRDSVVAQVVSIYNKPGVPSEQDFGLLVGLLRDEAFFGERARGILSLTIRAGRSGAIVDGEPMKLSTDLAGEVLDVLIVGSDVMRLEPLSMVLQASTMGFLWTAAEDPRAGIRTVAAAVLANHSDPKSIEFLRALVADPDKGVEASAVLAICAAGMIDFKEEILLRARVGDRLVRIAALRGLANMPGADTQAVLRQAVLEQDAGLRVAAVESLATLADPSCATLLASMFAAGPTSPLFKPAKRGLRAMGEPAWNDLLGLARSRTNQAKRDAALLLSDQSVLDVTTILITMLTDDPKDMELVSELAVLTCVDYSQEPNPAEAWWAWWDRVGGTDPFSWFCGALAAAELTIYGSPESLGGQGTLKGGLGLLAVMRGEAGAESFLVERSRRELSRLLGRDIGGFPPRGRQFDRWCAELEFSLGEHYAALEDEWSGVGDLGPEPASVAPASAQ